VKRNAPGTSTPTRSKPPKPAAWDSRLPAQLLLIGAGLAALVFGSDYLVQASVNFAKAMGVSDLVIGLTIVAAGTSMPEVATSITAAIKGERDIAVGNVVGSNTFNILGCLGLSGLVSGDLGLAMAPSLLAFDIWVMLAVALACLPVFMTGREIARWEGGVFLGYYVAYVAYLILAAQQHDALQAFSGVMLGFVVPLTVVTLVVVLIRRPAMASIRDLVVHVNDDVVSRHAFELASSLAADLGAGLMAVLVAAPVNAGVGLSAETASLAQQLAQAQRRTLLGIGERLAAGARQRHDLAVDVRCVDGDPVEVLQSHARAADLLITSQRDPAREGGLSTGQRHGCWSARPARC
jgi:hypothetical protein